MKLNIVLKTQNTRQVTYLHICKRAFLKLPFTLTKNIISIHILNTKIVEPIIKRDND